MEELSKDQIRDWLASKNRDRSWLAKACGVSRGTVDQWFAERGFSDSAIATIKALMEVDRLQDLEATPVPDETGLIEFTTSEFEQIEEAREIVGSPARKQFYRDAIIQFVAEIRAGLQPIPVEGDQEGMDPGSLNDDGASEKPDVDEGSRGKKKYPPELPHELAKKFAAKRGRTERAPVPAPEKGNAPLI